MFRGMKILRMLLLDKNSLKRDLLFKVSKPRVLLTTSALRHFWPVLAAVSAVVLVVLVHCSLTAFMFEWLRWMEWDKNIFWHWSASSASKWSVSIMKRRVTNIFSVCVLKSGEKVSEKVRCLKK